MDCPNCGVYNPEEREVCWRCNAVLPKQPPPKRRSREQNARLWLYVALAAFAVVTAMRMCGVAPAWLVPEVPVPPEGALPAHMITVAAPPSVWPGWPG